MDHQYSITNFYRDSIKLLGDGIYWVDEKGVILDCNHALLELLNYDSIEGNRLTIFEINPHLNRLQWKRNWKKLTNDSSLVNLVEYMNSQGEMLVLNEQMIPIKNEAQDLMMVIVKDVYKNIRAQSLLELTTAQGKIGGWEMDYKKESFVATSEFYRLFNLIPKEDERENFAMVTAFFTKAFTAEISNYFRNKLETLSQIPNTFEQEFNMTALDGQEYFYHITCRSLAAQHESLKIQGTLQDITHQKKRLQTYKLSQVTLDKVQEMIFWIDNTGQFTYVNEFACEKMLYSREDLLRLDVFSIAPKRNRKDWDQLWLQIKNDKNIQYESIQTRSDGVEIPVKVSLNYIEEEETEYICAVIRDIQIEKIKEAELSAALYQVERLKDKAVAENVYLQNEIRATNNFDNIISSSENYFRVLQQVEQVARTDATVLILGETGTGKELLARAVHRLSGRNDRPLVKVNCAALPKNLIESELFGHEKGAFTGAIKRKIGRFELANKGTIFLDEIGEIPIELQPKLLRVLQEGEFERVGSSFTQKVNVRVIAATNRDLPRLIEEEKFREDLYYRLNVFPIINIPLRERKEDIPLLTQFFVSKFSEKIGRQIDEIPQSLIKRMQQYDFPGNIRELENIIERAVILTPSNVLTIDEKVFSVRTSSATVDTHIRTFEEVQKDYILEILKKTNWQVSGKGGAAELLGLNSKTLTSKMRKFNIRRQDYLDF